MDSQNGESSAQVLVVRDGPKYHVDPSFILFCRESWFLGIISGCFYICLLKSIRAKTCGQRHIPVIFQGGMVACNLAFIVLLSRQWYSYHTAFERLDKEFPNQIYLPVHIALYLGIFFSCLLICVVVLILLSLWRPRLFLGPSRRDEEVRHRGTGRPFNPHQYNQPLMNWVNQLLLTCLWILTCVSMQAKLPGATYANMHDAHLFPPSRLEVPLNALANAHSYLGIVAWLVFSFVVFNFGKTLVLFRVDVVTRVRRVWRTFRAEMEVRRANERALRASRGTTTAGSSGWPSSFSTSSNAATALSSDRADNTHFEMGGREGVDQSSWETVGGSPETPQSARLRN